MRKKEGSLDRNQKFSEKRLLPIFTVTNCQRLAKLRRSRNETLRAFLVPDSLWLPGEAALPTVAKTKGLAATRAHPCMYPELYRRTVRSSWLPWLHKKDIPTPMPKQNPQHRAEQTRAMGTTPVCQHSHGQRLSRLRNQAEHILNIHLFIFSHTWIHDLTLMSLDLKYHLWVFMVLWKFDNELELMIKYGVSLVDI